MRGLRDPAPDGRDRPPLPRPLPRRGGRRLVLEAGRGDPARRARPARSAAGPSFRKEGDILDVWFESGSSHRAVLKEPSYGLGYPAYLYLEGSDQHRGWFQSSILTAVATTGRAPFEGVLTHGFIVDEHGKKMAKSGGNAVSAVKATEQYGADVLRLYVASLDYADDVRMSERGIKETSEAYRKIRNTFRYLLGNLEDYARFDPSTVDPETLHEIDRWALGQLNAVIRDVTESYERFEFYRVYQRIYQFCAVDLSSFYLDVLKDRLYAEAPDGPDRRAAQYRPGPAPRGPGPAPGADHPAHRRGALGRPARRSPGRERPPGRLARARPPVGRPRARRPLGPPQAAPRPGPGRPGRDAEAEADRQRARRPRSGSAPTRKAPRGSTGACWRRSASSPRSTSSADRPGPVPPGEEVVTAEKSPHAKCERCWNYRPTVGQDAEHPTLCDRCVRVVASTTPAPRA